MDVKHHYNMYKLSLSKVKKKSQFYSEDEQSDSPNSISVKKTEFQTDDSDSGTPLSINKLKSQPNQMKSSRFKQQAQQRTEIRGSKPHLSQNGLTIIQNKGQSNLKQVHSEAELKTSKESKLHKLQKHPFRHLIFSDHVEENVFQKHLTITQRGLVYATKCLKGPSEKFLKSKQVEVPVEDKRKKILVLDLDETLVHSCYGKEKPQFVVKTPDDQEIGINVRPYVTYFLDALSTFYSIFIFTASSPGYATTIIDYLDPDQNKILGILTRNHCMETKNGFFIKDLRILKDVDLKDVLIVDNLSHSFGLQLANGVPILEWQDDLKDQELKYLVEYLIEAAQYEDVREYNKQKLRLTELINFNLDEYIQ